MQTTEENTSPLEDQLAEAMAAHPALVRASSDAWAAMLEAQNVSRDARNAERENLKRIEYIIRVRTTPTEGLHPQFDPAGF